MSTESEKKGIEASFKSMDTEEFLDIYFNRPIGYAWALLFKKLKVHPNVVTIFSIILGIGAGVMFYYPDMKHTLIGILLLMWQTIMTVRTANWHGLQGRKPSGDVCWMALPVIFGSLLFMRRSVSD